MTQLWKGGMNGLTHCHRTPHVTSTGPHNFSGYATHLEIRQKSNAENKFEQADASMINHATLNFSEETCQEATDSWYDFAKRWLVADLGAMLINKAWVGSDTAQNNWLQRLILKRRGQQQQLAFTRYSHSST